MTVKAWKVIGRCLLVLLAIAQAIVQAHHGKIWAESRNGCNTFHVELPLRTGREKHQETSEKGI